MGKIKYNKIVLIFLLFISISSIAQEKLSLKECINRAIEKNISINNFQEKIKIFQLALSDKENSISNLNESKFVEGGSNSSYESNIRQNYLKTC